MLDLSIEQKQEVKRLLGEQADGMFQWVHTALREISNAWDHTFQELIDEINSLPPGLDELYNASLGRMFRSLDGRKIDRIKQTLTWLLLARGP